MSTIATDETIHTLKIQQEIEIATPIETTFLAVLDELGAENEMPGGVPFPMNFEPWPGGRWFRDLGNNSGHLWGHVQVIKPPKLLEIRGPLFMSYPAVNFIQYRLTEEGSGTRLSFTHRAMGLMPDEDRTGVVEGWTYWLERIRELAERRKNQPPKQSPR